MAAAPGNLALMVKYNIYLVSYTCLLVFLRHPEAQARLHRMFLKQQVTKKYLVITKGVPNPLKG